MPPILTKHDYPEIIDKLNATTQWFNSIDIQTNGSRLEEIVSCVNLINTRYKTQTIDSLIQNKDGEKRLFSLMESHAFIAIYEAFNNLKSHELPRRKLSEILKGPFLPSEEELGDSNVNPRNYLFELELAARFTNKGIAITGFDDIGFKYGNYSFNVQCKRIFSDKGIKSNIEKAYNQLKQRINNKSDARGIIALSIEKILKTDQLILTVNTKADIEKEINRVLDSFRNNNRKYWNQFVDIRIVGIMAILKFIAIIKEERNLLTSGFQLDCIPLCSEETLQFKDYNTFKTLCEQLTPE